MAALQEKIEKIVTESLDQGQADLETLPNGHVCGHVISREFDGKTYEERRIKVNEILKKGLNRAELAHVSTLLTYTPQEWSFEPREA